MFVLAHNLHLVIRLLNYFFFFQDIGLMRDAVNRLNSTLSQKVGF